MPTSERRRRTAGLDGLRAVAALSVLCLHVWLYSRGDPSHPSRGGFLDHAAFELRLGLVFFFVLSGYLLYRAFAAAALRRGARVDIALYARRRIARIVPAYYLAIGGAFVLLWGGRGDAGVRLPDAGSLPLFFVFGQNYSHATFLRLNPVSWTLCLEAAFYVLLPLIGVLAYRLGRRGARAQGVLLIAFILVGIGWNAAVYSGGWSDMAGKALPGYMPYFAFGMLVALWAERRRARGADTGRLSARTSAALVAAGLAIVALDAVWHATATRPGHDALLSTFADLPAGAGFALVVLAAVAGAGASVRWMSVRPLAWVGLVSYGVYLWHVPLLLFARRVGVLPHSFLPTLALALPCVLAVSAASWYFVERPLIARAARVPAARRERRRAQARLEAHAAP